MELENPRETEYLDPRCLRQTITARCGWLVGGCVGTAGMRAGQQSKVEP